MRGVVTQLVRFPTSTGGQNGASGCRAAWREDDGDPTSSRRRLRLHRGFSDRSARWMSGARHTSAVVGDEILLRGNVHRVLLPDRAWQSANAPALAALERYRRHRGRPSGEVETTEANPADSLTDANRYWERHEGMRFHLDAGAHVVAARDGFPSTKDAELWVIRGDTPSPTSEPTRTRGSSTATRTRWTTSRRRSTTATACGSCCRATASRDAELQRSAGRPGQHLRHRHQRARPAGSTSRSTSTASRSSEQLELEAGVGSGRELRRRPRRSGRRVRDVRLQRREPLRLPRRPVRRVRLRRQPRLPGRQPAVRLRAGLRGGLPEASDRPGSADRRPDACAGPADDPGGRGPGHLHRRGRRSCSAAARTTPTASRTRCRSWRWPSAVPAARSTRRRSTATAPMTAGSSRASCIRTDTVSCCQPTRTTPCWAVARRSTTVAAAPTTPTSPTRRC